MPPDDHRDLLSRATSAITPDYLRVPTAAGTVIRERVYCYELYHQLRLTLPPGSNYTIHGELDKRAHPAFKELSEHGACPDILLHVPGSSEGNFLAIEVKAAAPTSQGIRKDLATLTYLRWRAEYMYAVLLLYEPTQRQIERVQQIARNNAFDLKNRPIDRTAIELWVHRAGFAAERVRWT